MANTHEFAKLLGTGRATGSIVKVCNVHATDNLVVTDHSFGVYKSYLGSNGSIIDINAHPNKSFGSSGTNLNIAGTDGQGGDGCVEGPFIAINVSAGSAVIYFNGDLVANGITS